MNMESPLEGDTGYEDGPLVARRKRRRVLIAAAIVVIGLIGLLMILHSRKAAPPAADQAPRVTVIVPGRQAVDAQINASGIIAARHDMPVGAVGEGGMVTQVLVNPGDWVKAGQPLAIVERSVQTQQAAGAAASVRSAEADAALAQSNLVRAQALVKNGFISKADIDAKVAARDQALARVALARAQYGEQSARNARLVIRAPAGGLVLARGVEPGQIVLGGQGVLFRIAEEGKLEMQARVAEQDLAHMHIGTAAQITPVGSSTALPGQIWQLSPIIDPTTRQGVARFALDYNPALRPGGFASAVVDGGQSQSPLLPESAVLSDDKGPFVLIVNGTNVIERRPVTVGGVNGHGVTIKAGLTGTERVVESAGSFLSPGDKVIPALEKASR
jgi:RND family efflux transporter MFP subunit